MKDKLAKLMGEKKKISPIEQKAKMNVLEQLKKDMQDMMGDKVAGLKKVTVASPDKEGLELGLEKAKSFLGEGEPESEESEEHELSESPEIESEEHQDHMKLALGESPQELSEESEEEIDSKIQELLKKKELLKK